MQQVRLRCLHTPALEKPQSPTHTRTHLAATQVHHGVSTLSTRCVSLQVSSDQTHQRDSTCAVFVRMDTDSCIQHPHRGFAIGTSTPRAESLLGRMRRVNSKQPTLSARPLSPSIPSRQATPSLRRHPLSSLPATPSFSVEMARFRIGTPGPRRRETPLERNTRVNGRAPPPPSDPFRAARPPPVPVPTPIVREPFISPSMPTSARFLSSLRSRHEQRAPSAKARLDFSAEDISSRSSPSTSARRPVRDEVAEKLDVLKAHINSLVRLKKWRDALAKIEEALSLHPNCWDLQLQQAHVQHKMLAYVCCFQTAYATGADSHTTSLLLLSALKWTREHDHSRKSSNGVVRRGGRKELAKNGTKLRESTVHECGHITKF